MKLILIKNHKKIAFFMLSLFLFALYEFPFYIFSKDYQKNPRLYLATKEMDKTLQKEYVYSRYDTYADLQKLYEKHFNGTLKYNMKEFKRLNDPTQGGEPFWECIKKGKLYVSETKENTMLTYRHTNAIGTCELTVQQYDPDIEGNTRDASSAYFDKRLNLKVGELTDHHGYNRL